MATRTDAHKTMQVIDDAAPGMLASAIVEISASMRRLDASGLRRSALVTLVHYDTDVPRRDIERVLDSLRDLSKTYTTGG